MLVRLIADIAGEYDLLRFLWLSRGLPHPLDAGDKIYSFNLARSLAQAGAFVRFVGHVDGGVPPEQGVEWLPVPGVRRTSRSALFSLLPIGCAIHATAGFRALLDAQLAEEWDAVVLDTYSGAWAIDRLQEHRRRLGGKRPLLIYISHNHEESLYRTLARDAAGSPLLKLAMWQNAVKVRFAERRLVGGVDVVTTITPEDSRLYAAQGFSGPMPVLTPGYSGRVAPERRIGPECPRRVIIVGSFRWVAKQDNLRKFVELADGRFADAGITFDVIGDVPENLLDELRPKVRATRFLGFVDDVAPYFDESRIAVVPEQIGGGFKLKFLDYFFARVPVAAMNEAAAGLPEDIRKSLIGADTLEGLVDSIVTGIDDLDRLNALQVNAFEGAAGSFDWATRGRTLLESVAAALDRHI